MRIHAIGIFVVSLFFSFTASAIAEQPYRTAWIDQFGTSGGDCSLGVSADSLGNVFISGYTTGNLGGPNEGDSDAFVSKYNAEGSVLWTRQLGMSGRDTCWSVSADGLGNVYISGWFHEPNRPNSCYGDGFLSKWDAAGNMLWTRQLGTSYCEYTNAVSADPLGNVYVSGYKCDSPGVMSHDAYIKKYDAAGNIQWTQLLDPAEAASTTSMSADGLGNVYSSGFTYGNLDGPHAGGLDVFVSKYDSVGNRLWARRLGTPDSEISYGVSADGLGNVYIGGFTQGDFGEPSTSYDSDAFVGKYDSAGNLLWVRQFGTSSNDDGHSVSADGLGNVYISGETWGSLGGPSAGHGPDAFIGKYDAEGNQLWIRQFGTPDRDIGYGVSADGLGSIYFSGCTDGSLGGPSAGYSDTFLAKLAPVPEPGTAVLMASAGLLLVGVALRGRRRFAGRDVASRTLRPTPAD